MIDYMDAIVGGFNIKLKPNDISPDPSTGDFFCCCKK